MRELQLGPGKGWGEDNERHAAGDGRMTGVQTDDAGELSTQAASAGDGIERV